MLPRRARLTSEEIASFRGRVLARSPYFFVTARPNGRTGARFAIVVSAKVDKRSTRRHTLKRRVYGLIEKLDLEGQDFIINIAPSANKLPAKEFRAELAKLFSKT